MTKPLDPEMKAMRAVERALRPLDERAERRVLEFFAAHHTRRPWVRLPARRDRRVVRR